ncbi:pimeloyl-ACP methyl ester carboxylesterase [Nocardiopsis sp. Huas11]|uniref:alpha/beta fold hydrolase n=1 Tax=Nocardiopsis sp. Huas11 TaxID=2183912 RepID=UPI000F28D135|nr:alpha/beta hydrolase [Nocardiopsis sp. Huas11]RKS09414.1 pimeloyl-ACP methyl ester carboxylesterase [Nocardiopsis sp. Huas11]
MDHGGIVYARLGRGEPLLLLHGLGHRRQAWDPVLRALAERYEVFALDLPGFGQSAAPAPDRPFGISALVDAVQDWCEAHGLHRPHVVGNSLGGAVALELGARGLASSVTALAPIGFTSALEMLGSRLLVGGMHLATRVPARAWHAVIDSRPVRTLTTLALHGRLRDPGGGLSRLDPAVVTRGSTYTRLAPEVVRYSFGGGRGVACPTTIAWGEEDRVLPIRALARVLAAIPHARQVRLMGCGHIPMESDPATVVEVVLRTCRTAAPATAATPAPAA